jgi:hypothetical protein
MKDSFTSLIILLVLFFVLPSLFKLLGQYTLGSKGIEKREPTEEEAEPQESREAMPGHPEKIEPVSSPLDGQRPRTISNKPIHPKWF